MKRHRLTKNNLTPWLMIGSIALLITLEFFWLKDSYEKTYVDLRRESSLILKTTVSDLRDSLFSRYVDPLMDSLGIFDTTLPPSDSLFKKIITPDSSSFKSDIQVLISSTDKTDTNLRLSRRIAGSAINRTGRRNFTFRMMPDTLNIDTLTYYYKKTLYRSRIGTNFMLHHNIIKDQNFRIRNRIRPPHEMDLPDRWSNHDLFKDTLRTERAFLNPANTYHATFPHIRTKILGLIAPQISFSVLLIAGIVASFIIMYRSLKSQEKLNDLKNDFISNVTHELKTPVATVSVALEALKDFNVLNNPERAQEYLGMAQSELNRLSLMTDKILKSSIFEKKGISFIPESVNMDKVIQQVLDSLKLILVKKSARVNYEKSGEDFVLQGSETHLTNIVYNLVDNALKYGNDNSSIDIELTHTENKLKFVIRDHGIGIAKEFHKKVFEKFFRVPTGNVHNVKGYGLGLSYVASVIKAHDGKIELESEPGKGSTFTLTFPIAS